jgi:hypothetical protein
MEYRVTVEYFVNASDEEAAVAKTRKQLERDDLIGHHHDEDRLDYMVREVH